MKPRPSASKPRVHALLCLLSIAAICACAAQRDDYVPLLHVEPGAAERLTLRPAGAMLDTPADAGAASPPDGDAGPSASGAADASTKNDAIGH